MIEWDALRIAAAAAGARLVRGGGETYAVGGPATAPGGPADAPAEPGRVTGPGPRRVTIDSRALQPGDLFVGLPGERVDGGAFAEQALRAGAWGVLVTPECAARAAQAIAAGTAASGNPAGATAAATAASSASVGGEPARVSAGRKLTRSAILAHSDPLLALQALARSWRRELGAKVVAITGSTGKTSTKDILAAVLSQQLRTTASPQNLNTEIGLPLAVLAAPRNTDALVLEMAMRGPGQIAELVTIAEPDVGVIVNVGPVHLELLGSIEAIAAAKAELIAGLAPGTTVVVPAREPLLAPHLRADLRTVTFGEGGDVEFAHDPPCAGAVAGEGTAGQVESTGQSRAAGEGGAAGESGAAGEPERAVHGGVVPAIPTGPPERREVAILEHRAGAEDLAMAVEPSFSQSHNLRNLLAAVAAARALGITPGGRLDVTFSALRGERIALADGIVLINDCYNANPMSMRAALDDLAASARGRRVAVLGDMLELGAAQGPALHREVAAYAGECGVELLLAVGPHAAEMASAFPGHIQLAATAQAAAELLGPLLQPGDTVLVKGSRGVGLERVAEGLAAGTTGAAGTAVTGGTAATGGTTGAAGTVGTARSIGEAGAGVDAEAARAGGAR